jgi:hypothetical protein
VDDLERAVGFLACRCDGAVSRDDVGYRADDTAFGHRLALLPAATWTQAERQQAWEMVQHYGGQLAEIDVDPRVLPEPIPGMHASQQAPTAAAAHHNGNGHARATRLITADHGAFSVSFPYDAALVDAVKALPGRRFSPEHKCWTVPASGAKAILAFAAARGFTLTPEAQALATASPTAAPATAPSRTVTLDGKRLVVRFDYDADLVARVRELVGATWDKANRRWTLPVTTASVAALEALRFSWRNRADVDATLATLASNEAASKATSAALVVPGLGGTLRPFQAAGVAYALGAMGYTIELLPSPNGDYNGARQDIGGGNDAKGSVPSDERETGGASASQLGQGSGTGRAGEGGRSHPVAESRRCLAPTSVGNHESSHVAARCTPAPSGGADPSTGEPRHELAGWERPGAGSNGATAGTSPGASGVRQGTGDPDGGPWDGAQRPDNLQGGLWSSRPPHSGGSGRNMPQGRGSALEGCEEGCSVAGTWVVRPPAARHGGCLICDEPGLGKTVEALATIQAANAYPALVVCPASMKLMWQREARHWLPDRSVAVANGTVPQADIVIINYDLLGRRLEQLAATTWQAVVLDESHYIKSGKAQRTKAALQLCERAPLRLLLSGTPLLNRPVELVSQLKALGRLDEFGGYWKFVGRYCGMTRSRYGIDVTGAANLDELHTLLRQRCYVRRTKTEVLTELPAKQRVAVPLDLDNATEYRRAERDVAGYLRDRATEQARQDAVRDGADMFTAEHRATVAGKRAASAAETAEQLVRIEALKRLAAQGKLVAAQGWITDFLDAAEGEKLVVFAHHVDMQTALWEAFPGAARLMAEDSVQERQANVDRFQTDPDCRLIVCSLTAGGVGITLTAASNVAFLELGWTPAAMSQAEDRVHRIGQRDAVTAWYLLAAGTIDEDIEALLEAKRAVVDAATDGGAVADGESILADLLARLDQKGA